MSRRSPATDVQNAAPPVAAVGDRLVSLVSLFTSFGTLICCALPALLVLPSVAPDPFMNSTQLIGFIVLNAIVGGFSILHIHYHRDLECEREAKLREAEASAETLPHRRKYLLLTTAFLRRLLDLHLELIDEVERTFAQVEPARAAGSATGQGG